MPTVRAVAGPDCELIARLFVCPDRDASTARAIGKRLIAAYLTVPVYAAFHEWLGRGEILRPMQEAWAAGDRKRALELIPDKLVDELVVHGTAPPAGSGWPSTGRAASTPPSSWSSRDPGFDEAEAVRQLAPA